MAALAIATALPAVLQLAPLITDAIKNIESIFRPRREAAKTQAEIEAVNSAKMSAVVSIAQTGAAHLQSAGIIPAVPDLPAIAAQAQQIFNDTRTSLGTAPPVGGSGTAPARLLLLAAELAQLAADELRGRPTSAPAV